MPISLDPKDLPAIVEHASSALRRSLAVSKELLSLMDGDTRAAFVGHMENGKAALRAAINLCTQASDPGLVSEQQLPRYLSQITEKLIGGSQGFEYAVRVSRAYPEHCAAAASAAVEAACAVLKVSDEQVYKDAYGLALRNSPRDRESGIYDAVGRGETADEAALEQSADLVQAASQALRNFAAQAYGRSLDNVSKFLYESQVAGVDDVGLVAPYFRLLSLQFGMEDLLESQRQGQLTAQDVAPYITAMRENFEEVMSDILEIAPQVRLPNSVEASIGISSSLGRAATVLAQIDYGSPRSQRLESLSDAICVLPDVHQAMLATSATDIDTDPREKELEIENSLKDLLYSMGTVISGAGRAADSENVRSMFESSGLSKNLTAAVSLLSANLERSMAAIAESDGADASAYVFKAQAMEGMGSLYIMREAAASVLRGMQVKEFSPAQASLALTYALSSCAKNLGLFSSLLDQGEQVSMDAAVTSLGACVSQLKESYPALPGEAELLEMRDAITNCLLCVQSLHTSGKLSELDSQFLAVLLNVARGLGDAKERSETFISHVREESRDIGEDRDRDGGPGRDDGGQGPGGGQGEGYASEEYTTALADLLDAVWKEGKARSETLEAGHRVELATAQLQQAEAALASATAAQKEIAEAFPSDSEEAKSVEEALQNAMAVREAAEQELESAKQVFETAEQALQETEETKQEVEQRFDSVLQGVQQSRGVADRDASDRGPAYYDDLIAYGGLVNEFLLKSDRENRAQDRLIAAEAALEEVLVQAQAAVDAVSRGDGTTEEVQAARQAVEGATRKVQEEKQKVEKASQDKEEARENLENAQRERERRDAAAGRGPSDVGGQGLGDGAGGGRELDDDDGLGTYGDLLADFIIKSDIDNRAQDALIKAEDELDLALDQLGAANQALEKAEEKVKEVKEHSPDDLDALRDAEQAVQAVATTKQEAEQAVQAATQKAQEAKQKVEKASQDKKEAQQSLENAQREREGRGSGAYGEQLGDGAGERDPEFELAERNLLDAIDQRHNAGIAKLAAERNFAQAIGHVHHAMRGLRAAHAVRDDILKYSPDDAAALANADKNLESAEKVLATSEELRDNANAAKQQAFETWSASVEAMEAARETYNDVLREVHSSILRGEDALGLTRLGMKTFFSGTVTPVGTPLSTPGSSMEDLTQIDATSVAEATEAGEGARAPGRAEIIKLRERVQETREKVKEARREVDHLRGCADSLTDHMRELEKSLEETRGGPSHDRTLHQYEQAVLGVCRLQAAVSERELKVDGLLVECINRYNDMVAGEQARQLALLKMAGNVRDTYAIGGEAGSKLEKATARLADMRHEESRVDERVNGLRQNFNEAKDKVSDAQKKVGELKAELKGTKDHRERGDVKARLADAQKEVKDARVEVLSLVPQLEKAYLQKQFAHMDTKVAEHKLKKVVKKLQKLQKKEEKAATHGKDGKGKGKMSPVLKELNRQLSLAEVQLGQAMGQLQQALEEREELQGQLERLQNALDRNTDDVNKIQEQLQDQTLDPEQRRDLEFSLGSAVGLRDQTARDIQDVNDRVEALSDPKYQENVQAAEAKVAALNAKIDSAKEKESVAASKKAAPPEERKEEVRATKTSVDESKQKLSDAKQKLDSAEKTHKKLEKDHSTASKKLADAKKTLTKLEAEKAAPSSAKMVKAKAALRKAEDLFKDVDADLTDAVNRLEQAATEFAAATEDYATGKVKLKEAEGKRVGSAKEELKMAKVGLKLATAMLSEHNKLLSSTEHLIESRYVRLEDLEAKEKEAKAAVKKEQGRIDDPALGPQARVALQSAQQQLAAIRGNIKDEREALSDLQGAKERFGQLIGELEKRIQYTEGTLIPGLRRESARESGGLWGALARNLLYRSVRDPITPDPELALTPAKLQELRESILGSQGQPEQEGPSQEQPEQAGPSQEQPEQAGPSQGQPEQAGPSQEQPEQAGPSQEQPKRLETPEDRALSAALEAAISESGALEGLSGIEEATGQGVEGPAQTPSTPDAPERSGGKGGQSR